MADQVRMGRLSPWLRSQRIGAARPHIRGRVLDYGCGSGALADLVTPGDYLGYDPDAESIAVARQGHPEHEFTETQPAPERNYDTVVSLAVLEHIQEPAAFLRLLRDHCKPDGRIVLTTPHPRFELAHTVGARIGVFSQEAHDEHEDLLDQDALADLATEAGMTVSLYRRFLAGANQLVVLT